MGQTKDKYIASVTRRCLIETIQRKYREEEQVIEGLRKAKKVKIAQQVNESDRFKDNPFIQGSMEALRENLVKKIADTWSRMDIDNQILGREFRLSKLREEAKIHGVELEESA